MSFGQESSMDKIIEFLEASKRFYQRFFLSGQLSSSPRHSRLPKVNHELHQIDRRQSPTDTTNQGNLMRNVETIICPEESQLRNTRQDLSIDCLTTDLEDDKHVLDNLQQVPSQRTRLGRVQDIPKSIKDEPHELYSTSADSKTRTRVREEMSKRLTKDNQILS
jgi:hypothetical protein